MARKFLPLLKGYRMRSKVEARWGVAFSMFGWEWSHEPEGYYVLGDGSVYLPDFYVIGVGWHEIKSDAQGKYDRELDMLHDVVKLEHKAKPGYFLAGYIPDPTVNGRDKVLMRKGVYGNLKITHLATTPGFRTTEVGFCVCETCGKVGIEWHARGALVCGSGHMTDVKKQNGDHPKLLEAFAAARAYDPQEEPQYEVQT